MKSPRKRKVRASAVTRLPDDQRAYVDALMRQWLDGRIAMRVLIARLQERFPDQEAGQLHPKSLQRYGSSFAELTARMREIDRAAEALVGELGEGIGDKAGALLANAVTTLATNAAMRAQEDDDVSIDEVRKLAIAARNALDTRRMSLNERRALRDEARAELQREQSERLSKVVKESGLSDETAATFRRKVLGIKA